MDQPHLRSRMRDTGRVKEMTPMKLHHEADVLAPIDRVWANALDSRTAPMARPGGRFTSTEGHRFTGQVSEGVGLARVTYRGESATTNVDPLGHRAEVTAAGGHTRGLGRAHIRKTPSLRAVADDSSHAVLDTDLAVVGSTLLLMGPLAERIAAPLVAALLP